MKNLSKSQPSEDSERKLIKLLNQSGKNEQSNQDEAIEPHQLTEGMTEEQIEKFLDGMMELMRKKSNGT